LDKKESGRKFHPYRPHTAPRGGLQPGIKPASPQWRQLKSAAVWQSVLLLHRARYKIIRFKSIENVVGLAQTHMPDLPQVERQLLVKIVAVRRMLGQESQQCIFR
jgi:hypothetical protein